MARRGIRGSSPSRQSTIDHWRDLHSKADRPVFFGVDASVRSWLQRMMAIEPGDRFPSAAAASEALLTIFDGPDIDVVAADDLSPTALPTLTELGRDLTRIWGAVVAASMTQVPDWVPTALPPTPALLPAPLALRRRDVGALNGLESVQQGLWKALQLAQGRVRVVVLEGIAGRESVVRWLLRQARACGLSAYGSTDALPERLGEGTTVVALASLPAVARSLETWVAGLGATSCLVVVPRWPEPDQRIALPILSDGEVKQILSDRLPLVEDTLVRLAREAGGDVDRAFRLLDAAIASGEVIRSGGQWAIPKPMSIQDLAVEERTSQIAAWCDAHPMLATQLAIASAADAPVRIPDVARDQLVQLGAVASDSRMVGHASALLERTVELDVEALQHALAIAVQPIPRSRILVRMGRRSEALEVLVRESSRALSLGQTKSAASLLSAAASLGLPVGGRITSREVAWRSLSTLPIRRCATWARPHSAERPGSAASSPWHCTLRCRSGGRCCCRPRMQRAHHESEASHWRTWHGWRI